VQFFRLIVLIVFLAATPACAGGSPAGSDAAQPDPEDAGDTSSIQDASDAADAADVADTRDDPCGACCPDDRTCLSRAAVGVCDDDGSQYTEQTCGESEICEEGICVDEPICDPGETACNDATSRLICRPDGTQWRTESCASDTACVDGECVSGGANGTECSASGDCAGGKCRCGSDESCSASPSRNYCTSTCTPGSCGPDALCVASDQFNPASYDHCLPTCNQSCAFAGMTCASLPTRDSGELTFEQACYFEGVVDVGEACPSPDNCTGDTCLEGYFGNTNLCTFECAGDCPTGSACVELESGTFHCTPLCGDGSIGGSGGCPLERGGDLWDIQCGTRNTFDGFARRVCVST
jgi:hypothetical protein